nr:cytoplasmic polyadenylated homeobox-like protein 2 [Dasypus novemcinctus]
MARQVHCHVSVIDNWFQNKRARLPPRERRRLFDARKLHEYPVQGLPLVSLPDAQAKAPKYTAERSFSCAQEALLPGAGCSSLKKQCFTVQQVDSGDSGIPGIKEELGYALENPGDTENASFPDYPFVSYSSAVYTHLHTPSMNYSDRASPGVGRRQHANPFLLDYINNAHGVGDQQEEQSVAGYHYPLLPGQEQTGWGCHLQQPQEPQNFLEKSLFQEQLIKPLNHQILGQYLPSLQSQQQQSQYPQTNDQSLCPQLQQATPQMLAKSPLQALGQGFQQDVAEQPRAQMQQYWDEGSSAAMVCMSGTGEVAPENEA